MCGYDGLNIYTCTRVELGRRVLSVWCFIHTIRISTLFTFLCLTQLSSVTYMADAKDGWVGVTKYIQEKWTVEERPILYAPTTKHVIVRSCTMPGCGNGRLHPQTHSYEAVGTCASRVWKEVWYSRVLNTLGCIRLLVRGLYVGEVYEKRVLHRNILFLHAQAESEAVPYKLVHVQNFIADVVKMF